MSFWKTLFKSVPVITVTDLQSKRNNNPKPILLDVRTTEEYRSGHIPGADSMPLDNLSKRMKRLPKNREIVCICRSGKRSKQATQQLEEAGFTAFNMKGGLNAWSKAGFRVKTGNVK